MYYLVVGTIKPNFDAGLATPRADMYLNWGYILIILGIVFAVISAIFTGIVKGVNAKTLIGLSVGVAIIAIVAYVMAKGYFDIPYAASNDITYSGKTHGWVEFGLNFFYITLVVAILSILFSVIYKAVKK